MVGAYEERGLKHIMGLNETPSSERVHIGFFGRRNAGKSSIVNAVTGQDLSIVSDTKGTTTDPVKKSMELLPIGPVLIIDTPGFDDEGELGSLRIEKTKKILNITDVAVLVVDAVVGLDTIDKQLVKEFEKREIPYVVVFNKSDLLEISKLKEISAMDNVILASAKDLKNIEQLKEMIAIVAKDENSKKVLLADIVEPGDVVVLVVPIDGSAPKGRLILPQQLVIRELLDNNVIAITTTEKTLEKTLKELNNRPKIVVTDSQVFGVVKDIVGVDIPLTSFSILMARYKGFLKSAVDGARYLNSIPAGSKILISEGCTHHRQCEDIGTVKLPKWIRDYTSKDFEFEFTSGGGFPDELSGYELIVHCGGCMLPEKELLYRNKQAKESIVPFTNYGTLIAYINGILDRTIAMFDL